MLINRLGEILSFQCFDYVLGMDVTSRITTISGHVKNGNPGDPFEVVEQNEKSWSCLR